MGTSDKLEQIKGSRAYNVSRKILEELIADAAGLLAGVLVFSVFAVLCWSGKGEVWYSGTIFEPVAEVILLAIPFVTFGMEFLNVRSAALDYFSGGVGDE